VFAEAIMERQIALGNDGSVSEEQSAAKAIKAATRSVRTYSFLPISLYHRYNRPAGEPLRVS